MAVTFAEGAFGLDTDLLAEDENELAALRAVEGIGDLLGFAIHPLPAETLLPGELANLAVLAPNHKKRAANPSAKGYHAHG